jgi:hypothetical protein
MNHVLKSFAARFGLTDPQLRATSPSEQNVVDGEPEREFIYDPSASAGQALLPQTFNGGKELLNV